MINVLLLINGNSAMFINMLDGITSLVLCFFILMLGKYPCHETTGLKILVYKFSLKHNLFLFQMTQPHQHTVPCDHTLEYALHSLLRRRHHQAQALPTPRPVTAYPTQGGSKRLCLAGASALTAAEVAPCLQRCVVSIAVLKTCGGTFCTCTYLLCNVLLLE